MLPVKLLRFIASKWFTLSLALLLCLALPVTWYNLKVVWNADMLSQFWYIGLVFVCNLLGALLSIWKFLGQLNNKESTSSNEW